MVIVQFLGVWYQVQPNFDSDDDNEQDIPSCEFYNVTKGEQPNTFVVNTEFELYAQFDGDKPLKYSSISTNYLSALDENLPAMMQITPTIGTNENLTVIIYWYNYCFDCVFSFWIRWTHYRIEFYHFLHWLWVVCGNFQLWQTNQWRRCSIQSACNNLVTFTRLGWEFCRKGKLNLWFKHHMNHQIWYDFICEHNRIIFLTFSFFPN